MNPADDNRTKPRWLEMVLALLCFPLLGMLAFGDRDWFVHKPTGDVRPASFFVFIGSVLFGYLVGCWLHDAVFGHRISRPYRRFLLGAILAACLTISGILWLVPHVLTGSVGERTPYLSVPRTLFVMSMVVAFFAGAAMVVLIVKDIRDAKQDCRLVSAHDHPKREEARSRSANANRDSDEGEDPK